MKTKSLLALGIIVIMHLSVKAQVKIGTNPTSINSASLLELESSTQGFVLPRVAIGDVSASSPLAPGLLTGTVVYNTSSTTTGGSGTGIYLWDGTKWVFISTGSAVSSSAWLLTGNSGLSSSTNYIGTTDAIDFVVRTANTERMRILGAVNGSSKAGWIGMGVTIPRSSLDITGHYTNKNVLTIENSSTSGYSSVDMLDSAGNLAGTFGYANLGTGSSFSGKDYFNGYGNDFLFTRGSSYDFIMKGSNGYVGLNTSTPSERLHVVGNIYLNGAFMPGGTAGITGNILTSAGAGLSPTWTSPNSLAWILTGNSGTTYANNFLGTTDNVSMRFRTNNVQRMIIDSLGRVGIGIGNPAYTLSVLSASNPLYLSGVQATSTFGADSVLTINNGIVKKVASSSITNNWLLTGNAGTNSAINFLGTTDNHPLKFKVNNTIAGFVDSSGGLGNTYFGSNAGSGNTTGNGNTLIGGGADSANNTGINNTALGYQSGYNNTSGGSNVFNGYQSGYNNTTASGNLFTGFQAGYRNTTGQTNVFSGYWTGYSNTTGSNNGFVGYLAGFGNTTGGNNVFIGSQTGLTNTTGSRNILIGSNTNVLSAALTNATAIGYNAKVALSNSLVLGDTASGNAVNVGIGVRNPLKRLHIDAAPVTSSGSSDSLKIDNLATSSSAYRKAILVIDSSTGYVSKQSIASLTANNDWSLTGNSGTNYATNFLGTTDNVSLRLRTNNTERMIIDSLGSVGIGSSNFDPYNREKLLVDYGATNSNTIASFTGSTDNYMQINLQNKSGTGNASTDYVATADDGTDSTYYVDMGINSSNYSFSIDNWGQAHDAYLYSNSRNLYIGTQAINSDVVFLVGGGRAVTNSALRIKGSNNNIVIGKGEASSTPIGNTLRGPAGYGANIAGGTLTIAGGGGTGTATGGNLYLNSGVSSGTGTSGIIGLSTSAAERMRIDASGNVGIGTTNPSNLLSVIAASNPLYLSGVQATSTFNNDSILTINGGVVKAAPYSSLSAAGNWSLTGNSGSTAGTNFIGTTDAIDFVTKTNGIERMRVLANGRVGIGVTNPSEPLSVKDTMEIRRVGSLSALLFTNTSGTGDFRIGGDGGDIFWQGGGGRALQMGSYWTTIIGGDRQTSVYPAFVNSLTGTSVLVQGQRDVSVPLGIQGNSASQSANLTEWRNSSGTVLSSVNKNGYLGIGTSSSLYSLSVLAASNPLYLSGVQGTLTFTTDSILTINAGVVKKAAYSALTGATTNTLTLSTNTLTSTVNGVAATSNAVSGVSNTSSANTLSTTVNGVAGTTVSIINTNSSALTQAGGLVNTVNGVTAITSIPTGTVSNVLGYNASGTPVYQTASAVLGGATTNTLALSTNTLTSTVNGVAATSNAVSGVSNSSSANTLSTTVNGVAGTTVPIINTNTNALTQAGGLVNTVNGVAATTSIVTGTVSNILGYNASGTPVYQTASAILGGATTNALALSGNTLTSTVNGVAATSNAVSGISNTSSANTLSTTVNGIAGTTVPIINTNTNALTQAGGLVTTVNGVAATTAIATGTVSNVLGYNSTGAPVYQALSNLSLSSAWNITGNTGTSSANFLGTTDNVSMRFRTNNVQRMIIDSLGKVGIGTNTPASDLTLYQSAGSAGSSKGFTFTGNSISGVSSGTGVLMTLGYNSAGNKQLWFGDGDYAGNAAGSFARFVANGTNFPTFDAVSGDGASRRYLALGVSGDANSGVIFGTDNTGTNPGSQVWDNGNMTIGSGYKSYAAPTNGLLVQGNVGIGTTLPSSALSVIASGNPMYVSGLTALTSFSSTDSVLTISAGTVKKAPYTLLSSGASSGWALSGNSISAGQFLGTTNTQALILKANNVQIGSFDGNIGSIALGLGAVNNTSDHNIAIGYNASTNNQFALALGYQATASGPRSVALGNGGTPTASGSESIAIGYGAVSSAAQTTAIGYTAQATNSYNIGLGYDAQATGSSDAIAIGRASRATQQYSIALGYNASSTNQFGVAIGSGATTAKDRAIVLGNASDNTVSVGIGTNAPNAKLHIVGVAGTNNPLQIAGLPTGTVGTDNILTINSSGVVGSVTSANFAGGYWTLAGNAASNTSFLGTTNAIPLQFKYNSTLAGYLDANNTSFGTSATSTAGTLNTAIGYTANAANNATAIGASSVASAQNNVAVGNSAIANGSTLETAIGAGANVNSQEGTALGNNAIVQGGQATSLGASSKVTAQYGVAVGYKSTSGSGQAIAVGYNSTANGQYSSLIGSGSTAGGQYSSVIGTGTTASGQYSTALGSSAQATAQNNTAVGYGALANNSNQATAIGSTAQATYQNTTAVGFGAQAINGNQTTALGASAQATVTANTAVGYNAQSTGNSNGTAIGMDANTTAQYATAIGSETDATTQYSTALGYNAQATGSIQATAIGAGTSATGSNSTVVGYGATTSQANALILGNSSANVGIGTSTPNTSAKLDVAGTFKLGSTGTVLNSMIKGTATATIGLIGIGGTSSTTFTVPNATVGAIVSVSPKAALPYSVVIGYAYVSSANTVTITFGVGGTPTAGFTTTLDVAVIQ